MLSTLAECEESDPCAKVKIMIRESIVKLIKETNGKHADMSPVCAAYRLFAAVPRRLLGVPATLGEVVTTLAGTTVPKL